MIAVFLVVPQLQRNARNTTAQAVARKLLAANITYKTQNGFYLKCGGNTCNTLTNISGPIVPSGIGYCTGNGTAPNDCDNGPENRKQVSVIIGPNVTCGATPIDIPSGWPTATPYKSSDPDIGFNVVVVVFQEDTGSGHRWCIGAK